MCELGRRRKRRKIIVKKVRRLPTIFQCPRCGKTSVSVVINKKEQHVFVKCAACGLAHDFEYNRHLEPVDYYSMFIDWFEEEVGGLG